MKKTLILVNSAPNLNEAPLRLLNWDSDSIHFIVTPEGRMGIREFESRAKSVQSLSDLKDWCELTRAGFHVMDLSGNIDSVVGLQSECDETAAEICSRFFVEADPLLTAQLGTARMTPEQHSVQAPRRKRRVGAIRRLLSAWG